MGFLLCQPLPISGPIPLVSKREKLTWTLGCSIMAKTVSKRKAAPGSQKLAGYLELGCGVLLLNVAAPTEHQPPTRPLLEPSHSMTMLGPRAGHANMCLNGILIMLPKEKSESISHSVVSNTLRPRGLYQGSSAHGILQARILEGSPFPSPGDLPNPGTEPRSPALQADSFLLSRKSQCKRDTLSLLSVSLKAGNKPLLWQVHSQHLEVEGHTHHQRKRFWDEKPYINKSYCFFNSPRPVQTLLRFFTN